MTVIMIISFSLVCSWWLNFNWWHLIKPTKFVNTCLVAHLSLPLLWIGIDTTSPKKATRAHLLCSVKHFQRVRRSFPPVIEMVTLQRDHFSHYKRDFKHCMHTIELAVYGLVPCESTFYTSRNVFRGSSFTPTSSRRQMDNAPQFMQRGHPSILCDWSKGFVLFSNWDAKWA